MSVLQVTLQGREVNILGDSPLLENLIIDYRQKSRCVYAVCGAGFFDTLVPDARLQPEAADNLDSVLFMRHQIAYFITCFIQLL